MAVDVLSTLFGWSLLHLTWDLCTWNQQQGSLPCLASPLCAIHRLTRPLFHVTKLIAISLSNPFLPVCRGCRSFHKLNHQEWTYFPQPWWSYLVACPPACHYTSHSLAVSWLPRTSPPQDSLKLDLQGKDSKTHQQTPFSQLLPRAITVSPSPCRPSLVPSFLVATLLSSNPVPVAVLSHQLFPSPNPPSFRVCLVSQLNKISVNSSPMSLRLSPSLGQSCQVYDTYCLLK